MYIQNMYIICLAHRVCGHWPTVAEITAYIWNSICINGVRSILECPASMDALIFNIISHLIEQPTNHFLADHCAGRTEAITLIQ